MFSLEKELKKYHHLNSIAKNGCTVLFGSDSFAKIPVSELSLGLEMDTPVYNRSISGLKIEESEKVLSECIYELNPEKIFINIGENDIEAANFESDNFISKFEWLLYTMHSHCKSRIYVVSLISSNPKSAFINQKLKQVAQNTGCNFIDITAAKNTEQTELEIFKILRCRLRGRSISMTEAFSIAN